MNDQFQMRGLWQAHWRITQGVTGHSRETADRTIISCMNHGVTPTVRAFAEKLRRIHRIVVPGFRVETGGAA